MAASTVIDNVEIFLLMVSSLLVCLQMSAPDDPASFWQEIKGLYQNHEARIYLSHGAWGSEYLAGQVFSEKIGGGLDA